MVDLTWMREAACKGMEEMFFPEGGSGQHLDPARKVCASCPVQLKCLDYGHSLLHVRESINRGVWGGMTPEEMRLAENGVISDRECEYRRCTNLIPVSARSKKPLKYCSPACARAESNARMVARRSAERLQNKFAA